MKRPDTPPPFGSLFNQLIGEIGVGQAADWLLKPPIPSADEQGRYEHWDKLRRLTPPAGATPERWWFRTKLTRATAFRRVTLQSVNGEPFVLAVVDSVSAALHFIDQNAAGHILAHDPIVNPDTRDQYVMRSLIEEAATSSILEGAAKTRREADEMLRSGRKPRDLHERMIVNNFLTMQHIRELKEDPLTPARVFELHRLVTQETLESPQAAGRLRTDEEYRVVAGGMGNEVFHRPPPANQLADRLAAMCDFANGKTPSWFLHPVLRAIILHFWLAYDHPFVDGNGRTARALFYWSMLRQGYWLCEFISISEVILKAPAKYGMAFLHTETDDNDLTYFAIYHLDVVRRAIEGLKEYVKRRTSEIAALEGRLRKAGALNHRQLALLSHGLRHPTQAYTIEAHRRSHAVAYQTARTDLLDLVDKGLLEVDRRGKALRFFPSKNLGKKAGIGGRRG